MLVWDNEINSPDNARNVLFKLFWNCNYFEIVIDNIYECSAGLKSVNYNRKVIVFYDV